MMQPPAGSEKKGKPPRSGKKPLSCGEQNPGVDFAPSPLASAFQDRTKCRGCVGKHRGPVIPNHYRLVNCFINNESTSISFASKQRVTFMKHIRKMHLGKRTVFPPQTELPPRLIYPAAAGNGNRGERHFTAFPRQRFGPVIWGEFAGQESGGFLPFQQLQLFPQHPAPALISIITQPRRLFHLSVIEISEDAGINLGIDRLGVSLLSKSNFRNLHHKNSSLCHSINSQHYLGLRLTNLAIDRSILE